MVTGLLSRLRRRAPAPGPGPRIVGLDLREDDVIYAVGDVHGCIGLMRALEARIGEDAATLPGRKLLVMLGDYVDRGPDSAGVLDRLSAHPPAGIDRRICLMGNHERLMLDFLADPRLDRWLGFGGAETLGSYGIDPEGFARLGARHRLQALQSHIPGEHIQFLQSLPLIVETPYHVFVHAGLRAGVPVAAQAEADALWMRDDFAETYADSVQWVVHGHSPVPAPVVLGRRIAVDTGAYLTGRLSAVRLRPAEAPHFLTVGERAPAERSRP